MRKHVVGMLGLLFLGLTSCVTEPAQDPKPPVSQKDAGSELAPYCMKGIGTFLEARVFLVNGCRRLPSRLIICYGEKQSGIDNADREPFQVVVQGSAQAQTCKVLRMAMLAKERLPTDGRGRVIPQIGD